MDELTDSLVDEVSKLYAEVLALRLVVGAPLSGDAFEYFDEAVANIDAYTLPLLMTEVQRETVRQRLEYTRRVWRKHQRTNYPGGWKGLLYCLRRMVSRAHRVVVGAGEPNEPVSREVVPLPALPR